MCVSEKFWKLFTELNTNTAPNERLAGAAVVAASLHGYNWWRRAVVVAWCGTLVVRSTR